jgi:hypothetical protein
MNFSQAGGDLTGKYPNPQAAALPATPLGYLTVNVNGTARKVAYY